MFKQLLTLVLLCGSAFATNAVYLADSASGGNSGVDCANAKVKSYFNSSGNWSATPSGIQIGPDTTVHLCGTFTFGSNVTGFSFQGSGTSGHPVTLLFEANAIVQATYWASSLGGTSAGGITTNGQSNIVIDGGSNGILQNTGNGSGLANQQASTGISGFGCTNCEVKKVNLINIYVNVSPSSTIGGGDNSVVRGIDFSGIGWLIHDNIIHDCGWCIVDFYTGTTGSNHQFYNNQIYNFGHAFAIAAAASSATLDTILIHDNDLHDTSNWDTAGCSFHMDGLHAFGTTGSSMDHFYFYNNYIHGNWGSCPTGFVFMEGGSGTPAHVHTSAWWNNVAVVQTSIVNTNGWFGIFSGGEGSTTTTFYNNTIIGPNATDNTACFNIGSLNGLTFRNNTASSCGDPVNFGSLTNIGTINNNFYGPSCQNGGNCFVWNGSFTGSFANWKTACSCDGASIQNSTPKLNSDGSPQSGSPVISAGTNLSSSATGNLATLQNDTTQGKTRTSAIRPGGATAWDIGAFQAPGLSFSPASVAFNPQRVSTTSSGQAVTITNTTAGTITLTSEVLQTGTNFTISANTCGASLANAASCSVTMTATPLSAASLTDNLVVTSSGVGSPQSIPLSVTGLADPVISPATGSFASTQTVTITDATAGVSIYYTLDGSAPTNASTLYSGSFLVGATTTIKAIAYLSGVPSGINTSVLTISGTNNFLTTTISHATISHATLN